LHDSGAGKPGLPLPNPGLNKAAAATILPAHENRCPLLRLYHFLYSTPRGGLKTGSCKNSQTKTRPEAGFFIPATFYKRFFEQEQAKGASQ